MQYIYDKSDVLQPVIKQEVDVEADTRLIGFGEIVESPKGRRFSMKEAFQTVKKTADVNNYLKDADSAR